VFFTYRHNASILPFYTLSWSDHPHSQSLFSPFLLYAEQVSISPDALSLLFLLAASARPHLLLFCRRTMYPTYSVLCRAAYFSPIGSTRFLCSAANFAHWEPPLATPPCGLLVSLSKKPPSLFFFLFQVPRLFLLSATKPYFSFLQREISSVLRQRACVLAASEKANVIYTPLTAVASLSYAVRRRPPARAQGLLFLFLIGPETRQPLFSLS